MILCSTGLYAQVHINDGVTISKGTYFVITNLDVVIETEEIQGEGVIVIDNDKTQNIIVNSDLKSSSPIKVKAKEIEVTGNFAVKFSARHLPKLSDEIRIAAEKEEKEALRKELPVRYINIEGLVYHVEEEDTPSEPIIKSLPIDPTEGFIISEVQQIHAIDFKLDYIIPIYSILNDVRFSDDAKLYEFESLTAILKPPIV